MSSEKNRKNRSMSVREGFMNRRFFVRLFNGKNIGIKVIAILMAFSLVSESSFADKGAKYAIGGVTTAGAVAGGTLNALATAGIFSGASVGGVAAAACWPVAVALAGGALLYGGYKLGKYLYRRYGKEPFYFVGRKPSH